jgi:ribonuclease P/MRP protein subunit POP5
MKDDIVLDGLSTWSLRDEIHKQIELDFGLSGVVNTSTLVVKYYSPYTNIIIIRISKEFHSLVLSALFFMKNIRGNQCSFRVRKISGTIKLLQKGLVEFDLQILKSLGLKASRQERIAQDNKLQIQKLTT